MARIEADERCGESLDDHAVTIAGSPRFLAWQGGNDVGIMCHMVRGWGTVPWKAVVALALTLVGLLALSMPALGAGGDPPPVPKPDPPPKVAPPPPPPVRATPPPATQPVAPAPVITPSVTHPTAAEIRAAAVSRAKRKAARAARAKAVAAKKAQAVRRRERAQDALVAASSDTPSSSWGLPFILIGFSIALALLGLALMPARAVPWSRASRVLDDRRDEFGVIGAMGLVATVVFFLLVQVTK